MPWNKNKLKKDTEKLNNKLHNDKNKLLYGLIMIKHTI